MKNKGDLIKANRRKKMDYMGNQEWWDQRFAARTAKLMKPEAMLVEDVEIFKGCTKILDIACGEGRNAIYLALQGFEVTAVDFSQIALERLKHFAANNRVKIRTLQLDCADKNALNSLLTYDAMIVNHYKLNHECLEEIRRHLRPDGVLWINGFKEVPAANPCIGERDLLDEQLIKAANLKVLSRNEYGDERGQFIRYILRG